MLIMLYITIGLEPITSNRLNSPFLVLFLNICTARFVVCICCCFFKDFCSLYQVIRLSGCKIVNIYLYLYLIAHVFPLKLVERM